MNSVVGIVYEIISLSAISALVCAIVGNCAFTSSVRVVCSITILSSVFSLVSPVLIMLSEFNVNENNDDSPPQINDIYHDTVISDTGGYICRYTKEMLVSRYEISEDTFTVSVTLNVDNPENVYVECLTVNFIVSPDISAQIISEFVAEKLMCRCIVLLPDTT